MNKPLLGIIVILVFTSLVIFLTKRADNTKLVLPEDTIVEEENTSNYTDSEFSYRLTIPDNMRVERQTNNSILIVPDAEASGMGPANFVYISIVTAEEKENTQGEVYNYSPADYEKFSRANTEGDVVDLSHSNTPEMSEWFTYTLVTKEIIDGAEFNNFQNVKPWGLPGGTVENRLIYDSGENIYIIGYYTGGDDITEESSVNPRTAYALVKSFKFP